MSVCQICTSPYRNKIETMYFEGFSPTEISVYIENTYGVKYSPKSITNHCKNHVDINTVRDMVDKADAQIEKAKAVAKLKDGKTILHEIIKEAESLREFAKKRIFKAEKARDVEVYSNLWHQAARRTIDALKELAKIEAPHSVEEITSVLKEMWGDKE